MPVTLLGVTWIPMIEVTRALTEFPGMFSFSLTCRTSPGSRAFDPSAAGSSSPLTVKSPKLSLWTVVLAPWLRMKAA